jgi:hypothetical protein
MRCPVREIFSEQFLKYHIHLHQTRLSVAETSRAFRTAYASVSEGPAQIMLDL